MDDNIFDQGDLQATVSGPLPPEDLDLPAVRKAKEQTLGFTEKKFSHLPARESQLREAIFPITSKPIQRVHRLDGEEVEPVWLKQKGDHMYNRGDFKWSLPEYTKAVKADPTFLMARLNRSANYVKLREYDACLRDLDDIMVYIHDLDPKEKALDPEFYSKMELRVSIRKGTVLAW